MKKALIAIVVLLVGLAAAVWFVPALRTWCAEKLPLPAAVKTFLEARAPKGAAAEGASDAAAAEAAKPPASEGAAGGEGESAPKAEPPPAKAKTKSSKVKPVAEGDDDEDDGIASSKDEDDDDLSPALRGVTFAQPMKAAWCVTRQIATVFDAKTGKTIGNVAGGRFFVVEDRKRNGRDVDLIGNFMPKKLADHDQVRISAEFVYGFTGSPKDLSKKQRRALRDFYELRGKAEERKGQIYREAGSKSPFFKDAAAATIKFQEKANQFKRLKAQGKFTADQEREAHYKLKQLQDKVETLNAKHVEWKQQHPEAAVDPAKDATYKELVSKSEALRGIIPGMTF